MKTNTPNYKKTVWTLLPIAALLVGSATAVNGQTPTGTFANAAPIMIPATGTGATTGAPANPYPSDIAVSGFSGTVKSVTVRLIGLSHTFPDDIDILLVGPGGQNAIIMSDVGSGTDAVGLNITLDDAAGTGMPDAGPLVSGTFAPTNVGQGDAFPAPAPAPSGGSALSVFNGAPANGTWSLYVVDDAGGDVGSIAGGWELTITTANSVLANISTRGAVQTGDDVLIGGFIVSGTDPKTVLIRAIGPSLTAGGVPNALPDPLLELHGPDGFATLINHNWRDSQQTAIMATGIPPTDDLESAILATLEPGAYTTIVRGENGTTGNALVEIYGL